MKRNDIVRVLDGEYKDLVGVVAFKGARFAVVNFNEDLVSLEVKGDVVNYQTGAVIPVKQLEVIV